MHESEVAQSCLTLRDPMDCGPPGSSIHGIFQARVLEWGAIVLETLIFKYSLAFSSCTGLCKSWYWWWSIKALPSKLISGNSEKSLLSIRAPSGVSSGSCWDCVKACLLLLNPAWFPFYKCEGHSFISFLPTNLHLRACFLENSTCTTGGRGVKGRSGLVPCLSRWWCSLQMRVPKRGGAVWRWNVSWDIVILEFKISVLCF